MLYLNPFKVKLNDSSDEDKFGNCGLKKHQNVNPQSQQLSLLLKMLKFNIAWPTFVWGERKAAFSDVYIRSLGLTNFSSLSRTRSNTADAGVHSLGGAVLLLWSTLPKAIMEDSELQTSVSEAGWTSLGSPAFLGLHLAFSLGTGDYLPNWQIYGSGPEAER